MILYLCNEYKYHWIAGNIMAEYNDDTLYLNRFFIILKYDYNKYCSIYN